MARAGVRDFTTMHVDGFLKSSLYVRIECEAFSGHRNPEGIYCVDVADDKSLLHAASAAIQIVREHVPFLDENLNRTSIRVFSPEGSEILLAVEIESDQVDFGSFKGRASDHPPIIALQ